MKERRKLAETKEGLLGTWLSIAQEDSIPVSARFA
jgi:hypothetical protein